MSDPFEEYRRKHSRYLRPATSEDEAAPAEGQPRRASRRGFGSTIWNALKDANNAIDQTIRHDLREYRDHPRDQAMEDIGHSLHLARGLGHGVLDAPLMLAEQAGKLGTRIDRAIGIGGGGGATRTIHRAREGLSRLFGQEDATGWDTGGEVAGGFLGLGGAYGQVEKAVARAALASPRIAAAAEGTGRVARLARLARSSSRAGRLARGVAGNAPLTAVLEAPDRELSTSHLVGGLLSESDSPTAQQVGGVLEEASKSVGGRLATGLAMDLGFGALGTLGRVRGVEPVEVAARRTRRSGRGPRLADQAAETAAQLPESVVHDTERGATETLPYVPLVGSLDKETLDRIVAETWPTLSSRTTPAVEAHESNARTAASVADAAEEPLVARAADAQRRLSQLEAERASLDTRRRRPGKRVLTSRSRARVLEGQIDKARAEAQELAAAAEEAGSPIDRAVEEGGLAQSQEEEIAAQRRMLEQIDAGMAATPDVTQVGPGTTIFPRGRRLTVPVPTPEPVETVARSMGEEGRLPMPEAAEGPMLPEVPPQEEAVLQEAPVIDAGDTRVAGEGSGQGEGILDVPAQVGKADVAPGPRYAAVDHNGNRIATGPLEEMQAYAESDDTVRAVVRENRYGDLSDEVAGTESVSATSDATDTGLPGNLTDDAYNALHTEVSAEMGAPPKLKWKRLPDGTHEAKLADGRTVTLTNEGERGDPQWMVDVGGVGDPNIAETLAEAKRLARDTVHEHLIDAEVVRRAEAARAPEVAVGREPETVAVVDKVVPAEAVEAEAAAVDVVEPEPMKPAERTAAIAALSPVDAGGGQAGGQTAALDAVEVVGTAPVASGHSTGQIDRTDPLYLHHRVTARGIKSNALLAERALSLARQAERAVESGTGSAPSILAAQARAYADEVLERGLVAGARRKTKAITATGATLAALMTHPAVLKAQVGAVAGALSADEGASKLKSALVGTAVLTGGVVALRGLRHAGQAIDAISFLLPRTWKGAGRKTESLVRIATTARGDLPAATHLARIEGNGRAERLIRGGKYILRDFDRAAKEVYGGVKYMTDAEIEQIDLAFKGVVPIEQLPEAIRPHVTNFREYVDNLTQVMIDEGVVAGPMAATFDANKGFYARRSYQVFDDPAWAAKVDPAVKNRAEGYLRLEHPTWTDEQINGQLDALLYRAEGSPMAFLSERPDLAKSLGITKRRQDIAPEIRALWGEYGDARVNFMRSVADMSGMIGKHQVLTETRNAGLGSWLHEQPMVVGGESYHTQIVGEGSEALAPLNGLYTTPEIKAALTAAFSNRESNAWLRGYMKVVGAVKVAKTVGSVQATLRNFVSNTGFAMAQGLLNKEAVGAVVGGAVGAETGGDTGSMVAGALAGAAIVSGARRLRGKSPRITDAFRTVAADLAGAGPKAVPFQQRYQRYLELGVVSAGAQQGELQAVLRDASERGYAALYSPVQGLTQRGLQAASTVYRLGDDVWKIYHFESELGRYRQTMPNVALPELEKRTAEVVRKTHTYYDMVPGIVRGLRRAPMVGTFVSFPAEVVRIGKNTVQLIAEELKDPATRSIAMQRAFGVLAAASIPVAAGVASRNMAGVTPKQEEAMRHFLPPWDENAQLIHLGRDAKGRMRYVNVGFTNPWSYWTEPVLAVLRGDETWEQKAEDVSRSMLQPFVGEDILTSAVLDIARNKDADTDKEVFNPQAPARRRLGQIGAHAWKALEPGTVTSAKRIYKAATGQESASGRSYNLNDELVSVSTGQRRQMLDPQQSLGFKLGRWKDDMQHAEKILNGTLRDRGRLSAEDVESAYRDAEDARKKLFDEMHQTIAAAQTLGMSRTQVYQMLRGAQVNQQMSGSLLLGRYRPYRPGEEMMQGIRRSFQLSGRREEMQEREGAVRKAYLDRTRRLAVPTP